MPADESLSQEPTAAHGDGLTPYRCSKWSTPPSAQFSIDYGYCRTSLDHWPEKHQQGSSDPRCPASCPHKAPIEVAVEFAKVFAAKDGGAMKAAAMARKHKESRK